MEQIIANKIYFPWCYIKLGGIITNLNLWNPWGYGIDMSKYHAVGTVIHYKMWSEITYPFRNFNGPTVEVPKWISNSISNFIRHMITYPCTHVVIVDSWWRHICCHRLFRWKDIADTKQWRAIDSSPCWPTVWKLYSVVATSRIFPRAT